MTEEFRQQFRRQIDDLLAEVVSDGEFMRELVVGAVKEALAGAVRAEVGARVSDLFAAEPGFGRPRPRASRH